jgi:hypothetical protein
MRALFIPAAVAFVALAVGAGAAPAERLITGKDIKNRSITGKDVKNESLTRADFRGSVRGPAGPQGPAGTPGIVAAGLQRVTVYTDYGADTPATGNATATCPAGKRVVGGGGKTEGSVGTITKSYPTADLSGWVVNAIRAKSDKPWRVTAVAICVAG